MVIVVLARAGDRRGGSDNSWAYRPMEWHLSRTTRQAVRRRAKGRRDEGGGVTVMDEVALALDGST